MRGGKTGEACTGTRAVRCVGTGKRRRAVAGVRASELGGAAYSASKFGLSGLSKTIGVEEAKNGIRSCLIYPGEVNTPILDARPVVPDAERRAKMLQPEDLAQAALLIATLHPRATIPEMVITPTLQRFE